MKSGAQTCPGSQIRYLILSDINLFDPFEVEKRIFYIYMDVSQKPAL